MEALLGIGQVGMRMLRVTTATSIGAFFGLCIYRLFFHPYAKYPGPFLAKLTSWYGVYHAHYGDTHVHVWRLHKKYGDVVRYAPNRIIINTPEAMKAIYSHGKNAAKAKSYLSFSIVKGAISVLVMRNKKQHGKHRRIIQQGLGEAQIRAADPDLTSVASEFADSVGMPIDRFRGNSKWNIEAHHGWSEPKNMAHWSDYFTFDVMSRFTFGQSYGMLTIPDNHWILDAVAAYVRRVGYLNHLPELEDLKLNNVFFPGALSKSIRYSMKSKEIMEATQARVKAEKESGIENSGPKDLFSSLVNATDPETGEGISQAQLWADSNLLIVAGSDTSSTGLAGAFYYLSRNPEAYARVCKEVRTAFSTNEPVCQGPKLTSCTYLRACIQESIRLTPPGGGPLWRVALPGGLPVANLHIPEGCEAGTCIFSINHDEGAFPEPFVFRPERWLPAEAGDEAVARAKAAFMSFSIGPRNCPGKMLAMVEMTMAVAAVLKRYDFRMAEGPLREVGVGKGDLMGTYYCKDTFTAIKDGPYIQFKPLVA